MKRRDSRFGDMSVTMRQLLSELYAHGEAYYAATKWVVKASGVGFQQKTIDAAYDRALIKVVCESRHRTRQTIELTEIGKFAAAGLLHTASNQPVSEAASLMITEALSQ